MPNKNLTMYFSTCNHWSDGPLLLLAWYLRAFLSVSVWFGQSKLDGLWSHYSFFHVRQRLQWLRSLVALFKQENVFLQLLWQEWALPQGSKSLFLSSPSPFAALWCNVSPGLPLERLGPRPAHPRALSYYCQKTMAKLLCLRRDHSASSHHECVWFHGLLLPGQSSPHCWYVAKPTYTGQVLSLPLGDRASWWVFWLPVFKI